MPLELATAVVSVPVENEPYAGRYIESGSPETIQLWVASETGHTAALDTHPDEWERRVTTFLASALYAG